MPATIGDVVDRYRIEAQLESGGLHNRYRARHEHLHTLFSLVEIALHAGTPTASGKAPDPLSHERIKSTARTSARLQARVRHPNVLRLIDRFEHAAAPWLVEEYSVGVRLNDLVDTRAPLSLAEVDAVAAGLFAGVGALHASGIVHRDLKPRNVWVVTETGSLRPQVTGFWLARGPDGESHFPPETIHGTPPYMSPEHTCDIDACTAASDLWSLAVTLYVAVTGRVPFDEPWKSGNLEALFRQLRAGDYADPRTHRPDVPDRWRRAIAAALVVSPADRIQRVDELSRLWFGGDPPAGAGPRLRAPTGEVTLLFCDVEGSTSLWDRDPELARECLIAYEAVVRETLLELGGYEVKTEGDSFMIAFSRADRGLRCAIEIQSRLARQPWPHRLLSQPEGREERGLRGLRVRAGIHRCTPEPRPDATGKTDYFGPGVNLAARVMSAAHGGQVVADRATLSACGTAQPWRTQSLGHQRLRGLSSEIELIEIASPDLPIRTFTTPNA